MFTGSEELPALDAPILMLPKPEIKFIPTSPKSERLFMKSFVSSRNAE